ncbi:hypothetical protein [Fodinibius sp. SL11]|uniref:hypothetical protein n=1 Tax=Fodinibius sp. SL11 TaxID=3425690 RepID=UPI003F880CE8
MKNSLPIALTLFLAFSIWSCEQPKSPDFKVNNQVEIPLTMEKTYPFLGADEALVDTTSEDFVDLFTTDGDGLVRLVKEEKASFGDLNDAIPVIDISPTTVNPNVGEIEVKEFASSGNVGSIAAEDFVPGASTLQQGDSLTQGSANGIEISNFNPDYFESAIVENDGSLNIVVTNSLGFNADDNFNVILKSNGVKVGNDDVSSLDHNETDTAKINISAGDQLSNLGVEIDVAWSNQEMQSDPGNLVVNNVFGQDAANPSDGLMLSEVTAKIASQSFDANGTTNVDNQDFEFREQEDVIELSDSTQGVNKLNIDITNNIDIDIQNLNITFLGIEDREGNPYSISMSDIARNSSTSITDDISEHKITSEKINYTIAAQTQNTQNSSNASTIRKSDDIVAEINLQGLDIGRAEGYLAPRQILLNEDKTTDFVDNIDVFNDDEAEVTQIDGIDKISDRVANITFDNPVLNMLYQTNLGVQTTIYAVIVGTDSDGNQEFLTGLDGTSHQVQNSEIPSELQVNGQRAEENQVIKFELETASNPDPGEGESRGNRFDASNTNAPDFFSNLPTKIRFIGVAEVNDKQENGTVVNPVIFEPSFGVEIPFSLSANNATYKDTVDADFSDLPEEKEDRKLSEAAITINYSNGLPLDLSLDVIMLDANGNEVTTKSDIAVEAASTNQEGYATDSSQNDYEISFSESEMNDLHRTRSMVMDISINTAGQQTISLRENDAVTFKVKVRAGITSTIN